MLKYIERMKGAGYRYFPLRDKKHVNKLTILNTLHLLKVLGRFHSILLKV
jgi:hypothetical protein